MCPRFKCLDLASSTPNFFFKNHNHAILRFYGFAIFKRIHHFRKRKVYLYFAKYWRITKIAKWRWNIRRCGWCLSNWKSRMKIIFSSLEYFKQLNLPQISDLTKQKLYKSDELRTVLSSRSNRFDLYRKTWFKICQNKMQILPRVTFQVLTRWQAQILETIFCNQRISSRNLVILFYMNVKW